MREAGGVSAAALEADPSVTAVAALVWRKVRRFMRGIFTKKVSAGKLRAKRRREDQPDRRLRGPLDLRRVLYMQIKTLLLVAPVVNGSPG